MKDIFIIGVPASESDDLSKLSEQLGTSKDFSEQRYFDGAAYIEVIVPMVLSAAAWATLRAWIRARADILNPQYPGGSLTHLTFVLGLTRKTSLRFFS